MVKNVCFALRRREIGSGNTSRNDRYMIRTLICHSDRKFEKVWTKQSNKRFQYECGRVFWENYRVCHYGYSIRGGPVQKYKLPKIGLYDKTKLEDALIYRCYHDKFPQYDKEASLIALQSREMGESLVQYNIDTGQLMREIYLSNTVKFKYISWVEENEMFVVKSKHTAERSRFHMATGISMNIAIVMAVFSAFPLEFVGMFEVDRRVFGAGITNAVLSHNLLIVMYITGHVKFFSFQYILDKFKLFDHRLSSDPFPEPYNNGYLPRGLPMNIKITECPPVLFEVRCADHDVQIGGYPWHYIVTPHGKMGIFNIRCVEDKKMAISGEVLQLECSGTEPDRCIFHPDNSGRIIHIGSPDINIYGIHEVKAVVDRYEVKAIGNINQDRASPFQTSGDDNYQITSSGRCIRRKHRAVDEVDPTQKTLIHQVDYEDDLDLTWLSMTTHSPSLRAVLRLHDNTNFKFLKEIELQQDWSEPYENVVYFDLDTIVHVVKPVMGKFVCTMYRLTGEKPPDPGTETTRKSNTNSQTIPRARRTRTRTR